jgi:putative transposase
MSHSLIKCWVHALWATKEREPLIRPSIEQLVYNKIEKELRDSGCFVRIVNGMPDHVHCLYTLNPEKSISDTIKQVKGSSSHWVNQQNIMPVKFAWQTGSAVYSVSESQVEKVYKYIKKQKEHHHTKTWQEEFDQFSRLHGFDPNNPK